MMHSAATLSDREQSTGLKVPLAWTLPPPVFSPNDIGLTGLTLDDVEGLLMRSRLYAQIAKDLDGFMPHPGAMPSPLRRLGGKSVQELTGVCGGKMQVWLKCDHESPMGNSIHARAVAHAVLPRWPVRKLAVLGDLSLAACAARLGKTMGWSVEHHSARPLPDDTRWGLARAGITQHSHNCAPGDLRIVTKAFVNSDPASCWIDSCESEDTALAYACAAVELKEQLQDAGVEVSTDTPLLVLIPNAEGVAGAAVATALKQIYGRAVRTILVEEESNLSLLPSLMEWPRTSEHYRPHLPWVLARRAVAGVITVAPALLQQWVELVSRRLGWGLSPIGVAALASLGTASQKYAGLDQRVRSSPSDSAGGLNGNVVVWLTEAAGERMSMPKLPASTASEVHSGFQAHEDLR